MDRMQRAPGLQKTLDVIHKKVFGKTLDDCYNSQTCLTCGKDVVGFRDALSEKEYGMSGMCQECQDGLFEE